MNSDRTVPWVRISAEAVAIVGGILLAFAIDAWWDSRSDREMESQLLTRLKAELQENVIGIEEFAPISNSFDAGLTVVGELEDALAEGVEFIDVREASFWLPVAFTYDFSTAVLDSTVRSGLLDVIGDEEVVLALARWETRIRNYQEAALALRNMNDTVLLPALHERSNVYRVRFLAISDSRRGEPAERDAVRDDVGEILLRADSEITGLIAQKTYSLGLAWRALDDARDAASAAILAIDASIAN